MVFEFGLESIHDHLRRDGFAIGENDIEDDVGVGFADHDAEIVESEFVRKGEELLRDFLLDLVRHRITDGDRVHVDGDVEVKFMADLHLDIVDDIMSVEHRHVLIDFGMEGNEIFRWSIAMAKDIMHPQDFGVAFDAGHHQSGTV